MTYVKARASLSDLTRRRSFSFPGEEQIELNMDEKGKGVFCVHTKGVFVFTHLNRKEKKHENSTGLFWKKGL